MAGNTSPIFSRKGAITRAVLLKTAAADYTGKSPYNKLVFESDDTNGSFLQRLRFKALGTNVATVARIYLNDGDNQEDFGTARSAPPGTPSSSGGALITGTYYALAIAVDADGRMTPIGTISSGIAVTGPTGSISWSWGLWGVQCPIASTWGLPIRMKLSIVISRQPPTASPKRRCLPLGPTMIRPSEIASCTEKSPSQPLLPVRPVQPLILITL